MTERRRHAFVCGCPRSGTTALATLLNWHPSILMGQERYALLAMRDPDAYLPALFEVERFGTWVEGDCAPANFEKSVHWDEWSQRPHKLRDAAACSVRGDKAPHLFQALKIFEHPEWLEQDVTIFAMLRDVEEVAASYEARLRDANDSWKDDRFKALRDWGQAVTCLSRQFNFRRARFRIRLVRFEAVFERGLEGMTDSAARLYADMGLEMDDDVRAGIDRVFRNTEQRNESRTRDPALDAEVERLVPAETLAAYERLKDLAFLL